MMLLPLEGRLLVKVERVRTKKLNHAAAVNRNPRGDDLNLTSFQCCSEANY